MSTLAPSFVIGTSSFLQVTSTIIKAWMSLNFGQVPSLTTVLAVIERLKKSMKNVVSTQASSLLI